MTEKYMLIGAAAQQAAISSKWKMIQIAKAFNIEAQIIGHVEASEKKQLTIKSEFGTFEY